MVIRWTPFDRVFDVNVLWWVRIALNCVVHMHVLAIRAPEVMVMVVTVNCVINMVNASDWIISMAIVAIAAVAMTIVSDVVIAIPVSSIASVAMTTVAASTVATIATIATVSSVMIHRQMVVSMIDVIVIATMLTTELGLTSHSMAYHQG